MTLEPGTFLQHKSSSSLLRRMPVCGEYTIAPKLQMGDGSRPLRTLYYLPAHQSPAPPTALKDPLRLPTFFFK